MATYSEKLKDPRWQKRRLQILERDNWKCTYCGDSHNTLHIHHHEYTTREIWNEADKNLTTACKHCHLVIETIKQEGYSLPTAMIKHWMTNGDYFFFVPTLDLTCLILTVSREMHVIIHAQIPVQKLHSTVQSIPKH